MTNAIQSIDYQKQLNHTTFELAYRQRYVDNPKGCCRWIVSKLNLLWLKTFGRNGCWATNIKGADKVAEERAAIKQLNAKRDTLFAQLIRTPMLFTSDKAFCPAETRIDQFVVATKGNLRERNQANEDMSNYYKALIHRTLQLTTDSQPVTSYIETSLKELSYQICIHNYIDKSRSEANTQFINPDWTYIVKGQMAITYYNRFVDVFTPQSIRKNGVKRMDHFANFHLRTFDDSYRYLDEPNKRLARERLVEKMRNDIFEKHGAEFAQFIISNNDVENARIRLMTQSDDAVGETSKTPASAEVLTDPSADLGSDMSLNYENKLLEFFAKKNVSRWRFLAEIYPQCYRASDQNEPANSSASPTQSQVFQSFDQPFQSSSLPYSSLGASSSDSRTNKMQASDVSLRPISHCDEDEGECPFTPRYRSEVESPSAYQLVNSNNTR